MGERGEETPVTTHGLSKRVLYKSKTINNNSKSANDVEKKNEETKNSAAVYRSDTYMLIIRYIHTWYIHGTWDRR